MAISNRVRFQGMDVFWHLVKSQTQNQHEAALAVTHWMLISSEYRCIGRDSEFPATKDPTRVGSELLPERWNDRTAGFYSLLYVHPDKSSDMFLLKLIPASSISDSVILGQILISSAVEDVIPFELNSHRFIPENWQTFSSPSQFPEFKAFSDFVEKEIISKMQPKKITAGIGATHQPRQGTIPGMVPQPAPRRPDPFMPDPITGPPLREFIPPGGRNPMGIGSRDLDPFGGFGGNIIGPGNLIPGGFPNSGGSFPGRPYRYDPPGPPEFMPRPGAGFSPRQPPFGVDPFATRFPDAGRIGGGVGPFGGLGTRRPPAPLGPMEPDPDHERPPPPAGDDYNNMFM